MPRGVSDLGPALSAPEHEDEDNIETWLFYSLVARLFPIVDSNDEARQPSNQFKAILSMQAIKILVQVDDMTSRVQTILNETDNQSVHPQARKFFIGMASYFVLISCYDRGRHFCGRASMSRNRGMRLIGHPDWNASID
jgi:hypothetical protein